MTTQNPEARDQAGGLTSLPRVDELARSDRGFDEAQVSQAFEAFGRHITQLQTQLRVLQAAGRTGEGQPTGHAVRMDALHLVRAAAEFADAMEKDSQDAASRQIRRAEAEIADKQREFHKQELQIEQRRQEAEQRRNELLNDARKEAGELVSKAERDSKKQLQEAEAKGSRLLEQARHQAVELTNSVRAELDQSLEWSRTQANEIIRRAQHGAEQLLGAAGLGDAALERVVNAIMEASPSRGGPSSSPSTPSSGPSTQASGQSTQSSGPSAG
jgi:vacuolar-type H+-ATPase subunit H